MPVTMRDVAAAAGVSRTTVSHILNGEGGRGYNAVTSSRVLAAARRLGYRRNAAAQAVSRGRFASLALLQDARLERTHFDPRLLLGLVERLAAHGRLLTVASYDDGSGSPDLPRIVSELAADALLLNYHTALPAALLAAVRSGPPAVWINRRERHDCVWADDHAAGERAVRELLARGHRRIAYVDPRLTLPGHAAHYSRSDRHTGYLEAMAAAGLPAETWLLERPLPFADYPAWYRERLIASGHPTACITNFWPSLLARVAHEVGSPQALVCVGGAQNSYDHEFACLDVDWHGLGVAAVDLALERLAGAGSARASRAVPPLATRLDLLG